MPTFNLHPKQGVAFTSEATEILYGGAAGGGKSHLMRVAAVHWCMSMPGLQIYLFRRHYPDLKANHMDGPSGFPALLTDLILAKGVRINYSDNAIIFANGSKIHLCHCQHEQDVIKYQGAEMHVLMMDELTHFTEYQYRFLRGRVRNGPEGFTKILCSSNPGNIGHQWVKRTFVDYAQPMQIIQTPAEDGGMLRQYIPALLDDNPTLVINDPTYENRLEGLGSPDLVRALRYGLWDITAGAAFEKLRRDIHMLRPFDVPLHWTRFMAIDWGSSRPFSVGWFCVADHNTIIRGKAGFQDMQIPAGAVIMYDEWYGWNGVPNEGCRLESHEVACKALELEEDRGDIMDYRVGDAAMWARLDGPSIAEKMEVATEGRFIMEKSVKDRENMYEEMRARIAGEDGLPMFFVTSNCVHFWRTVPDLQLDQRRPEKGPDSEQEDHCVTGDTRIWTDIGLVRIDQIEQAKKVLTSDGLQPFINLGCTANETVYEIEYEDGYKVKATKAHRFLMDEDKYVTVGDIIKGKSSWKSKSLAIPYKSSMACVITNAVNTFKNKVNDCIEWCGNIITGKYPKDIMCTISTTNGITIRSTILNYLQPRSTHHSITKATNGECQEKHLMQRENGISQKKDCAGTKNTPKPEKAKSMTRSMFQSVIRAAKSIRPQYYSKIQKEDFAVLLVTRKTTAKSIRSVSRLTGKTKVYNIHVPGVNNYILENGVITHNCYDMCGYALMTRPMQRNLTEYKKERFEDARKAAGITKRRGGY